MISCVMKKMTTLYAYIVSDGENEKIASIKDDVNTYLMVFSSLDDANKYQLLLNEQMEHSGKKINLIRFEKV